MPEDSVASSHPIIVPVKRPEDISAVFDAISYNKVSYHMTAFKVWNLQAEINIAYSRCCIFYIFSSIALFYVLSIRSFI